MPLIVKSFTFVECSECHKIHKLEVGKNVEGMVCECSKVQEEEKPKPRMRRKKVEDATETV